MQSQVVANTEDGKCKIDDVNVEYKYRLWQIQIQIGKNTKRDGGNYKCLRGSSGMSGVALTPTTNTNTNGEKYK